MDITINEFIKNNHAVSPNRPYPCGYCYNCRDKLIDRDKLEGKAKVVVGEFLESEDSTEFSKDDKCIAGLRRPTDMGDCKKFIPVIDTIRIPAQDYILDILKEDYLMNVLCKVYAYEGISKKEVINRKETGYNTRTKRINELIDMDLIDEADGRLYMTYYGNVIASAISNMEQVMLAVLQEGDILQDEDVMKVLEFIRFHPRTSFEELCREFGITAEQVNDTGRVVNKKGNYDVMVYDNLDTTAKGYDFIFYQLLDMGFIVGEFDSYDWNTVRYSISQMGERQWQRHQQQSI